VVNTLQFLDMLLHENFHTLFPLKNIIWMTKSRRIRWMGHVAHMREEERCIQGVGGEA
jgi:hypothetical protein